MVFVKITGPDGQPIPAWQAIWPAFGATNQLLGGLALLVVYSWLRQTGRRAGFVLAPLVFMLVTTLTALGQLVYRHLVREGGSWYIGGVSAVMGLLALALIANAVWRLRGAGSGEKSNMASFENGNQHQAGCEPADVRPERDTAT
jgi:carbon starvation protein